MINPPAEICPICNTTERRYLFTLHHLRISRCARCGLVSQTVEPDTTLFQTNGAKQSSKPGSAPINTLADTKTATDCLAVLKRTPVARNNWLVVTQTNEHFAQTARQTVSQIRTLTLNQLDLKVVAPQTLDACIMLDPLEQVLDLAHTMDTVWTGLAPCGLGVFALNSLEAMSRQFLRMRWNEALQHYHYYFSTQTIQALLWRFGFEQVTIYPDSSVSHLTSPATTHVIVTARRGMRRERPLL